MGFIVNDCSLHGQFPTHAAFVEAMKRVLAIRDRVARSSQVVRAPRKLLDTQVGAGLTLRHALSTMDRNLRNAVVTWLANKGPFWDDEPLHGADDWFQVKGNIVTETGIGEATMALLRGITRSVVSFEPSNWTYDPIPVEHVIAGSDPRTITLRNHWELPTLERYLRDIRAPLSSWRDLVRWAREECPRLTLASDVIEWLDGHAFIPGAAERFQVLLSTLDTIRGSFDETGTLTTEGMRLLQDHFVGKKAWFTDSSDGEKETFANELTFRDPDEEGARRMFPWHGKVKIEQMRVHFSYPIRHDRPLHVVYIGPKLTKR
jgi:hypothetical protein